MSYGVNSYVLGTVIFDSSIGKLGLAALRACSNCKGCPSYPVGHTDES